MKILTKQNWKRFRNLLNKETNRFRHKPIEAIIEITHRCNLKCQMCGVWRKNLRAPDKELKAEDWQRFILEAKASGIKRIGFSGGEPLLRPDLRELTALVKSLGLDCGFFTNGTLIDSQIAAWIVDNRIDSVHFSIDGPGAVNDIIRGKGGAFASAEQGLRKLIETKKTRGTSYPEIDVHCTVSCLNATEILNLARWVDEQGVSFAFQIFSELGAGLTQKRKALSDKEIDNSGRYLPLNSSLRLASDQLKELKEQVKELPQTISTRLFLALNDEDIINSCFPIKRCYISQDYIFVDPYGNVFPCTNFDNFLTGNIKEKGLAAIWHSRRQIQFRKQLKKNLFPGCRHCCHLAHNLSLWQIVRLFSGKKL